METVNGSKLLSAFVLLGLGITIAGDGVKAQYSRTEKFFYVSDALARFLQPGLKLTIQKVDFTPPSVAVTFQLTDNNNQGLDRLGLQTPGAISTGFVLARIRPGDTQYTNYFTNHVTALPAPGCANCTVGNSVDQPAADSGGVYSDLGNGVYKYTFGRQLPANVDMNSTTTLVIYARRDLREFGFPLNTLGTVANAIYDFVPSGAAVTQVRDVVRTENCNQCHNPLALHGGVRQEIRLCVLCHNPGNSDPETGNILDAKVYIHKIHMGANLPSVSGRPLNILGTSGSGTATTASGATQNPIASGAKIAGKPYQIVGFNQGVNDFSTVVWPQDVRNCTTCHQKGTQSDNYKNNPSRAACGSCHDNVNFTTGQGHPGGVQLDDTQCSVCHPGDNGLEFDLSVTGMHTIPTRSKQLKGLNVKILSVANAAPGNSPTVSFTVTDDAGNPIDASKLNRLAFQVAGPTTDYTFFWPPATLEDARTATAGPSSYSYTFQRSLPKDASGTFAIGAEASRTVNIPGPLAGQNFPATETASNPVFYFSVDGSNVVPRRKVIDVDKCNVCHKRLAMHGGIRTYATEYCELCHNPKNTDEETRALDQFPPQTINMKTNIHRIHSGRNLENEWTIYGFSAQPHAGAPINFNGVRFPGDRRDCAKCHVNNSNQLPLPDGLAEAETPRLFYSPMSPTAQACLGCHDGNDAAAHAFLMTAPFGESCTVCHGEGADFAVSKVHAR